MTTQSEKKTNLLITGGAGFIGSNFTYYIANNYPDYRIVVLDALTYAGNKDNFNNGLWDNPNFKFIEGDIRDSKTVGKLMRESDIVVHFAAETHVDRSILEAGEFVLTDVYGTLVLLESARKFGVERFLHISTDEVYGEAGSRPSREDDPLFPKSPYAASKAGADRLAYSYFTTYDLPVVISRCSNNYGPYQYPEKLIPLFVTNALEGKPLPVYGSGKNTRDWIHVSDHCSALDLLLHKHDVEGEVFNIGSGEEKSINDIASEILSRLNKPKSLAERVTDRPGHVMRHAVDSSKMRSLGWSPRVKFVEGIDNTIEWYSGHREWWKKIKEQNRHYAEFMERWYGSRLSEVIS